MHPRKTMVKMPRWNHPQGSSRDRIILEEPLQITLRSGQEGLRLGTILRTPGHDYELVFGYLFALKLIERAEEVREISYCSSPQDYNRVSVHFRGPLPAAAHSLRNQDWIHGGCGACGQDELQVSPPYQVAPLQGPIQVEWLCSLPPLMRAQQALFHGCGASHAAGRVSTGQPLAEVREDVGRHNAVDKLVGHLLMNQNLPAAGDWLLLSGRAGFELVQKAVQAGFSAVASVGPPSSLAISYAEQAGLCLVGFLQPQRFNVYTRPELFSGP
ncbi:formate dehydrogenase accessory sulfurtransferase FdhD [bacterium]|nr:formate dehydrogenase accessory sulfurtransferase FdhD [bacterium]